MHKIKTYILDDEPLMVEGLKSLIENKYASEFEIIGFQTRPRIAIEEINQLKPDLLFIDVEMPNYNGFDVLKQLDFSVTNTVFITAYDQFAATAFDIEATDYLLKPIDLQRFDKTIQKILKQRSERELLSKGQAVPTSNSNSLQDEWESKRIGVLSRDGYKLLRMEQIIYVKADDNSTVFHLESGKQMNHSKNLKSVEAFLPTDQFIRISRFAIVKIDSIKVYNPHDGGYFILKDDSKHIIGYTYKQKLKSFIKERYLN